MRTCRRVNLVVSADYREKIEGNKKDKYLDFAREIKKRIMKVTVMPVVIGAFGTIPKGLVKGLEDLEIRRSQEATQTIALLWRLAVKQTPIRDYQLMLT